MFQPFIRQEMPRESAAHPAATLHPTVRMKSYDPLAPPDGVTDRSDDADFQCSDRLLASQHTIKSAPHPSSEFVEDRFGLRQLFFLLS